MSGVPFLITAEFLHLTHFLIRAPIRLVALLLSLSQLVKVVFQIVKKNFARGIRKRKIRGKSTPKN